MWRIRYIENGERKVTEIYAMSEDGAIASFKKNYIGCKFISIRFDSSINE